MTNHQNRILIVHTDAQVRNNLERLLQSTGFVAEQAPDGASAVQKAASLNPELILLGEQLADTSGLALAAEFSWRHPAAPQILFAAQETPDLIRQAMRAGITEVIVPPLKTDNLLRSVRSALETSLRRHEVLAKDAHIYASSLQRQVDEMETLARLGRQVTGSLDLDSVLTAVVDAAVELTGAEEGSLLLIDETTGDLYMRAARNFQEDFVRTFRLPITDSLAGAVIRSGEPILLDESTPQKIKTAYLVQSLLYVPLQFQGRIIGVLGVDNRHSHLPLTQRHTKLMSTLAGYAAVALENARLYAEATAGRYKLETILKGIQDGVIVLDQDLRLAMVNKAARDAFSISEDDRLEARPVTDIFPQPEIAELLDAQENSLNKRTEISPDENRVYSVQLTPIPDVGQVFTLTDITYLKKLDHIKTDFVHTVSHDLRSPLTAILGYVELIERAGPITDLQRDFIRRVQASVRSITGLVDDLLDLGRIESGFDVRKENVCLDHIIRYSVEGQRKQLADKRLKLAVNIESECLSVLANPVQMRQMIDNLLENAIKYTLPDGSVTVTGKTEQNQVIIQVADTGIGVPAMDLPYIFDKFYRASNASGEMTGTGLGLAIVKSIIENHGGRVWVESTIAKGSTFTVVLPTAH